MGVRLRWLTTVGLIRLDKLSFSKRINGETKMQIKLRCRPEFQSLYFTDLILIRGVLGWNTIDPVVSSSLS